MHSGARTAQPPGHGRETLWLALLVGPALLALALVMVVAGLAEPAPVWTSQGPGQGGKVTAGAGTGARQLAPQPWVQRRSTAFEEGAALTGMSPLIQPHAQAAAGRGRARPLPDTQSLIRLIRQRQDAIITAWTHRMRDASEPGAGSHTADRPRIVTCPLRGPPARG